MNQKFLHNEKVRKELGNGGTSKEHVNMLHNPHNEYNAIKEEIRKEGINVDMFALAIPVTNPPNII